METDPSESYAQQAPSFPLDASTQATLPFPRNVPIFEPCPHDAFYVRPCFPDYYDYIVAELDVDRMRGVTVTGPAGVGTSVFLAYFLHRYQLQHPDYKFVLVLMANDADSEFADVDSQSDDVLLWKNGVVEKKLKLSQMIKEVKHDPNVMFLVDGPPERAPRSNHCYVVCMSSSEEWTKKMQSSGTHKTFYMPLWDANELMAAVDALDLKEKLAPMSSIEDFPRREDETEVEYRFRVFGGVAGPCLETEEEIVDSYVQALKSYANTVDLQTGHQPRLPGDRYDTVNPALFHCYPSFDTSFHELKTASPYVTQLLSARVDAIPTEVRPYFDFKAMGFPAAAALRQSIVVVRMLTLLEEGMQLAATALAHPPETPEFDLKLLIRPVAP